jgi:hypothetical protein
LEGAARVRKYYRFIEDLRKFAKAGIEPAESIRLVLTLLKRRIAEEALAAFQ